MVKRRCELCQFRLATPQTAQRGRCPSAEEVEGRCKDQNMGPNQSFPTPPTYIPPTPREGSSPKAATAVMTRGSDKQVGHRARLRESSRRQDQREVMSDIIPDDSIMQPGYLPRTPFDAPHNDIVSVLRFREDFPVLR